MKLIFLLFVKAIMTADWNDGC